MDQPTEYKHEPKACPRCRAVFECKVGNVDRCQCQSVQLSDELQAVIRSRYEDCLCAACLSALKEAFFKNNTHGTNEIL